MSSSNQQHAPGSSSLPPSPDYRSLRTRLAVLVDWIRHARIRVSATTLLALLVAGVVAGAIVVRVWLAPAAPRSAGDTPLLDAVLRTSDVRDVLPAFLEEAVLDPGAVGRAVDAVQAQVRNGAFPGAAIAVGRGSKVVVERGLGRVAWGGADVDPAQTRYDLASLTKVVATTSAVMLLIEDGKMSLDTPVVRYLPRFRGDGRERVTVRHLLQHTSGLPAGGRATSLERVIATPLTSRPGARVRYSDLGMIVLWAAAERAAKEPLPDLLQRRIWTPLGMHATGFTPGADCGDCAPTGRSTRGVVHDPIARRLGGVAGNAGLFSTARDLGRFASMLAGGGALGDVRVFEEETVATFLRRQSLSGSRALGWDTRDGALLHTGYTGTSLWIDPDRGTWTVLLTNATYAPKVARPRSRVGQVRQIVHEWVSRAAERVVMGAVS